MGTRQAEVLYPRSRCAPEELDCWITTSGPTRHLPPGLAPFWLVVPRRTWETLVCATQQRMVLCWYSEHHPNVGRLSILRKCLVRASEPCHPREMGEVTPLKTEVWKHTHTFTSRTFYTTRPASGCHAVRCCPRTSCRRSMGVTLNCPTKGRVEVVQLNCCDTTINWKYPFLTGPERGYESDSCKQIYISFKN